MWRYLLARSPPLLSHLRRPPGNTVVAAVGCASRGVIRRAYTSAGTALAPEVGARHLYVVLDQINTGHSIYKLNVNDLDGGNEDALTGAAGVGAQETVPRRLPEAVLRLGVSSVGSEPRFEGLGSKIVVVADDDDCQGITFIYDTKTAKLDIAKPPSDLFSLSHLFSSVGDKLHLLTPPDESPQYLCEVPAPELTEPYLSRRDKDFIVSSELRGQLQRWVWKSGPSPPPLPEDASDGDWPVQSYAVHPDGHTIFFASPHSTFSLDTNGDDPTRRLGEWVLPFHGRAYYDHDLDAWIGIRKEHDFQLRWGRHYLCSCDVLSDSKGSTVPPPTWRTCKEELNFDRAPLADIRRKQKLVHTGRGRFCLVETVPVQEPERKGANHCSCTNNGIEHLLNVTMFRAKHGKNGELLVAPCRPGRSYTVPNYFEDYSDFNNPLAAFWM